MVLMFSLRKATMFKMDGDLEFACQSGDDVRCLM